MRRHLHSSRRRAVRPSCAPLEGRALLNASMPMPPAMSPTAAVTPLSNGRIQGPIITQLSAADVRSVSTVPTTGTGAGDLNPYGVAFVPEDFPRGGLLRPGDVLVSNFNNSGNVQGTGTTIVRITSQGGQSAFFTSQAPGLSTALGVLERGFVIVGNVPTTDGTFGTIGQGSLQIIDRFGHVAAKLSDPKLLDGPWDLTIHDMGGRAQVFVANVLTGTVTRIDLKVPEFGDDIDVQGMTQIASGYTVHSDPAAVVVGPTGLAYDARTGTLYVASTADNAIFAVANAGTARRDQGTGTLVYKDSTHLHGPLGLALAPNGDLLTTNGDAPTVNPDPNQPSELVEFTPRGQFVGQFSLDRAQGAAFGLALATDDGRLVLATVNDDTNALDLRTINLGRHH